jgi:hypothetical protein
MPPGSADRSAARFAKQHAPTLAKQITEVSPALTRIGQQQPNDLDRRQFAISPCAAQDRDQAILLPRRRRAARGRSSSDYQPFRMQENAGSLTSIMAAMCDRAMID